MSAVVGDIVSGVLLAGFVVVAAVFVKRAVAYVRLHHPLANRRFLARYRAEHPQNSRTTVEALSTSPALPVVRPRTPAGARGAPTAAPAGSTRGRHTG
ncbi:MAG: hypothetical protein GEV28_31700 [Actinophytocola sp.]|uniref:hypothetical protein n=1 Tax=Actinophytocola sp. TaxID=1872138 RepID=UPI0013295946|nr:hypothetical protein [Actinophytocola sp.]MPZ84703.1 hypothetical protein [Actinophytocola sp.]